MLSEIRDPNRLSHIEDAQVSVAAQAGEKHQSDRLRNRHEVTGALGVRHRNWAAALNLFFEDRNHAAGGPEHVPKTHCGECSARTMGKLADDQLSDALRSAHN